MTKKHFIEIAAILKDEREDYLRDMNDYDTSVFNPVERTAKRLATTFKSINPNFDRRRFLEACGIREE